MADKAYALKDELEIIRKTYDIDWPSEEEEGEEVVATKAAKTLSPSSERKLSVKEVSLKTATQSKAAEVLEMSEIHKKRDEVDGGKKISGVKQILRQLPSFDSDTIES
eukprot:m.211080 g.211080  ORF g.211080 m.211080 type:complete len:108 (+) comp39750_c2_seq14:434-757(+)